MCGIIGIVSGKPVAKKILNSLKLLEYRGYDSSGIATIADGKIARCRAEGKLYKLEDTLKKNGLSGSTGIGHTRWATHGEPIEINAHPHATSEVAVVHNGIIENFKELRKELEKHGAIFKTETDTEVIPHLITYFLNQGLGPEKSVREALKKLQGAYSIAAIFAGHDNLMIGAKYGSPLVVGYGAGEIFLSSDAVALSPWVSKISYLEDGDLFIANREGIKITSKKGRKIVREIKKINTSKTKIEKENYAHYMLKEIHEQVTVLADTLNHYYNPLQGRVILQKLPFDLSKVKRITIIACGTSYYAGMVARYWIEKIARIPVSVEIASEFRYCSQIKAEPGSLAIFISQSGETADTLAALRHAKKLQYRVLSIVNVPESTIARESEAVLRTYAGPEIGVASTKAFTNQLMVLACFTIVLARRKKRIVRTESRKLLHKLSEIPAKIAEILKDEDKYVGIAKFLAKARHIIYIGRGASYAIALEGALKLKEISYIHAEAQAAGELKHGSIALVDNKVPVVVIAPGDKWFEKTSSNAQEVASRKGKILFISNKEGAEKMKKVVNKKIVLPESDDITSPIIYAIPVQLLAYHVALLKGTDIDQPRNLAKAVTVE